jgi:ribosomal protein S18 acetylase RimI-like enzyme
MTAQVDNMTPADFEGVASVWEEAGLWPHTGEDRAWFEVALARNPNCSFVYREGGEIVGAVLGAWDGLRGWIYHLAVRKQHQGQGIGSALLAAAEERLHALGVRQINLMVYEENSLAESLYYRRGYERSPVKVLRKRFVDP